MLLRTSTYGELHGGLLDLLQVFVVEADAFGVAGQASKSKATQREQRACQSQPVHADPFGVLGEGEGEIVVVP